jgi:HAD superfamily hydrolase (TIGR01509 family)
VKTQGEGNGQARAHRGTRYPGARGHEAAVSRSRKYGDADRTLPLGLDAGAARVFTPSCRTAELCGQCPTLRPRPTARASSIGPDWGSVTMAAASLQIVPGACKHVGGSPQQGCSTLTLERLQELDAIVFDMDGVLLDSEPLHQVALGRVIADEGHEFTEEEHGRFVGMSQTDTWIEVDRMRGLREPLEHYHRRYDQEVLAVLTQEPLEPFPGVVELLSALRESGHRLGLATQSHRSWVEATLGGLGMRESFDAIVSGDMVKHGKPHPELYLRACGLLGADPARSLAIEDSLPGARAARAAGMIVVGVRNLYAGDALEREADVLVDRLDELLDPETGWPSGARDSTLSGDS